jgi:8-oxo-dGTP diphosphatase
LDLEPGRPAIHQVAAALIRKGDDILLVQQQGPTDPFPTWALPGGRVEPGERLSGALIREVREETGLEILHPDRLVYFVELQDQEDGSQSQAFVFEVERWEGRIRVADPDGFILNAGFFSLAEAMDRLEKLPWRAMREPLLAYLEGRAAPGSVWSFHRRPGGGEEPLFFRL